MAKRKLTTKIKKKPARSTRLTKGAGRKSLDDIHYGPEPVRDYFKNHSVSIILIFVRSILFLFELLPPYKPLQKYEIFATAGLLLAIPPPRAPTQILQDLHENKGQSRRGDQSVGYVPDVLSGLTHYLEMTIENIHDVPTNEELLSL